MKTTAKLLLIFCIAALAGSCKKDKSSSTVTGYQPRFFYNGGGGIVTYDTRDAGNIKGYYYGWDAGTNKYVYTSDIDTIAFPELKQWPDGLIDVVGVGYNAHILDRKDGNKTYLFSSGTSPSTSTMAADHPDMPASWRTANKIEGYASLFEQYGVTSTYSSFFFDLTTGNYLFIRDGIVIDEPIANLIKTPKGVLTSTNIDFTKADAVMYDYDRTIVSSDINNIYFLDYDAMKYIQISRLNNIAGDDGRNTLVTSDWTPMTNLITGWKF